MVAKETLQNFIFSNDHIRTEEILYQIMNPFMEFYYSERDKFQKLNDVVLPDNYYKEIEDKYSIYLAGLFIGMRERVLLRQEELENDNETDELVKFYIEFYMIYNYNRIFETEHSNIKQTAQLEVANYIRKTNSVARIYKRWVAHPSACPICQALNGTTIPLNESFLTSGQVIELEDGDDFIYNYIDREVAVAHPNDKCYIEFIIKY